MWIKHYAFKSSTLYFLFLWNFQAHEIVDFIHDIGVFGLQDSEGVTQVKEWENNSAAHSVASCILRNFDTPLKVSPRSRQPEGQF